MMMMMELYDVKFLMGISAVGLKEQSRCMYVCVWGLSAVLSLLKSAAHWDQHKDMTRAHNCYVFAVVDQ